MATAQPDSVPSTQTGILSRLIRPEADDLTPEAAEGFLRIRFEQRDLDRMHELAVMNQEGALGPQERDEMESYRHVGYLLDLIHSKARRALKKHQAVR